MLLKNINYMKLWFLIYTFTISKLEYTGGEDLMKQRVGTTFNTTSDYVEISNTLKLLKEGEAKIILSGQYKNVILVVGNTGSGKSTFSQWIAGDNTKLISREVEEGTGEYIIEDGNRISTSTLYSKTIFPDLVVDNETNAAYYDCPGFSDTRSTSHDIASTYFIKTVADHASRVKIVLVVNYHSVRKGLSRNKFLELMKHVCNLIKNIEKFKKSIAMVVTKVENTVIKEGRNWLLVPDEKIIGLIANFLKEVEGDLKEKLDDVDTSHEEQIFLGNIIELVNTLMEKDGEKYTRIGIFRRPDGPGPLSNITILFEGKENIKKMLYEELEYTKKDDNDFGYTISDKSKNDVNALVEMINNKIWTEISELVDKIQDHYRKLTGEVRSKIDSFVKNTEIVSVTETQAKEYSNKLEIGCNVMSRFLTDIRNITVVERLAMKINSSITDLQIKTCEGNVNNIFDQGRFLNFLQVVSNKKLNSKVWSSLFEVIDICKSKEDIEKDASQAAEKIVVVVNGYIENIAKEIKAFYQKKMETQEIEKLPIELNIGFHLLSKLINESRNLSSVQDLSGKISDIIISSGIFDFSKIQSDNFGLENHGKYLEFLNILNNAVDSWCLKWIGPFDDVLRYLSESEKWYTFLNDLYDKLSKYEVQKYKNRYDVADIHDWGKDGKDAGIHVNKNNFKVFLEKIKEYHVREWDAVKNLIATDLQLNELNRVLDLTLKNKVSLICPESGTLVIKGDYIKFSDFLYNDEIKIEKLPDSCKGGSDMTSVNIFALDTVIIDKDFNGVGKKLKLSIVAPKWYIEGTRKINLDGASVTSFASKANTGSYPSGTGSDGQPGLPGGPGGNFLGIVNEVINYKSLTITANGGQGGPGQEGGDGGEGRKGKNADKDDTEYKLLRDKKVITVLLNGITKEYWYSGKPGGVGGKGGNGGIGGYGGMKGKIKVIKFDRTSGFPVTKNVEGNVGKGGKGGRGGRGGRYGYNLKAKWCEDWLLFIPFKGWCSGYSIKPFEYFLSNEFAQNGADGCNGCVVSGRKQPENEVTFQNVADVINNYKSFLLKSLQNRFRRHSSLNQFADLLNNYANN